MSKISRFLLRAVLVVAVLAVAAYLYVNHAVTALHHKQIEAALSDASGFQVSSEQPFDLSIGRELHFSARDLHINHPDWSDSDALASIGSLYVTFNTWSALISPPVTAVHVELENVDIHIQEANGRPPNWETDSTATTTEDGSQTETTMVDVQLAGVRARASRDGVVTWSVDSDLQATAGLAFSGPEAAVTVVVDAPSVAISIPESSNAKDAAATPQERLFTDTVINLPSLSGFSLSTNILADHVEFNDAPIGQLSTSFQILGGGLNLEQLEISGEDTSITGSFSIQPLDDAYNVSLGAKLSNWRSELLAIDGGDTESIPPFDGELELSGTGNSLQAIMASANGKLSGRHSTGAVDLQAAGPLFSDVASGLIETLNPLAESSSQTALDCGVYEININDGLASVEQFSVQTDKLTVISSGEIDLGSEAIDMALRTKSREGLGLSIGSVATSFFRLGGTLSEPSLDVDAGGTVTTAGAAVATGGLSVLAKGLWDRMSAEADLCHSPQAEQPEEEPAES